MQDQDLRWLPAAATTGAQPSRPVSRQGVQGGRGWWQRSLHALRYPVWPLIIMALLLSGVLLMFQQVVAQGVVQGEARRSAIAARADGQWRCRLLNRQEERRQCFVRMGEA